MSEADWQNVALEHSSPTGKHRIASRPALPLTRGSTAVCARSPLHMPGLARGVPIHDGMTTRVWTLLADSRLLRFGLLTLAALLAACKQGGGGGGY